MNFSNRAPGDGWDWLEKGLADMLITDLHASGKFQVVTRERMQELFDEMALGKLGLLDPETAQQFGKMVKVDWALFGSFFCEAGRIEIECHLVEVATQKLKRVEWVRGSAEKVLELEKELAVKVVENFGLPLTDQERASLLRMRTRSVDAAAHFYTALGYVDLREHIPALVGFRQAARRDPHYYDARFWIASIYKELHEYGHAEVELRKLLALKGKVENEFYHKVVLTLGYLLELQDRNVEAVDLYMKAARENLSRLVELKNAGIEPPAGWYVGSYRKRADELITKEYQRTGRVVQPSHGIVTLTVDKPTYSDDFSTEKRFWDALRSDGLEFMVHFFPESENAREHASKIASVSNGTPEGSYLRGSYWHTNYVFKAQEGHVIDAVTVEMTGMVHSRPEKEPSPTSPVFGCQVWSLPKTRDFTRFPFKGRCASGPSGFQDVRKTTRGFTLTFPLPQPAIRAHLWLHDATLFDWKITAKLSPKPAAPQKLGTLVVSSEPVRVFIRLDDEELLRGRAPLVMENIPVGIHEVSGSLGGTVQMVIPETGETYGVRADFKAEPQKVEVREGEKTELVLKVRQEAHDDRGGRRLKEMQWHKAVTSPRSLSLGGASLMQDQKGTYWLVWSWGRVKREDQDDFDLWISSSRDGRNWQKPRKLPANSKGDDTNPQMLQRRDGTYWLAWIKEGDVYLSSSLDTFSWSAPRRVMRGLSGMYFHERASGTLHIAGKKGTAIFVTTSDDGVHWSELRDVFNLKGPHRFVFKGWCLTRGREGFFYIIWCACPNQTNDRRIFLARSDSHHGLTWSAPPVRTPLHKPRLSRGEAYASPVTGTGDPLLLVDRAGSYHVFSRSNGFYHCMSVDGHTWTPWQMISADRLQEGISWPRVISALQDRDGAFWLAIKANQILPDDIREKCGDIWLGRVKRFDQWGLVAE
jgi:tetratricopeptide (TPR) repeat protein